MAMKLHGYEIANFEQIANLDEIAIILIIAIIIKSTSTSAQILEEMMLSAQQQARNLRSYLDRIREPIGQCQACLSDKLNDKDFIITCDTCSSSIHNKHYGRQLDESNIPVSDKWRCERCRFLIDYFENNLLQEIDQIKCAFCPSLKGIMKRVTLNQNQIIWLHPECYTWVYPIISQTNNKRIRYISEFPAKPTAKFWVNLQNQNKYPCAICHLIQGYKIKCMHYTCQKYFHCSCAKKIGFIRDLESMRLQNSDTYIPPYCYEHIEMRIVDCQKKAKKFSIQKDPEKQSQFLQFMASYQIQLKNMQQHAIRYKENQEMKMKMQCEVGEYDQVLEEIDYSEEEYSQQSGKNNSIISDHPRSFYNFLEGVQEDHDCPSPSAEINFLKKASIRKDSKKQSMKEKYILQQKQIEKELERNQSIFNLREIQAMRDQNNLIQDERFDGRRGQNDHMGPEIYQERESSEKQDEEMIEEESQDFQESVEASSDSN